MAIDFRILGPLDVILDGVSLRLGGPRSRALLAALVIEADRFVSRDRLIDELWGDEPPATAENALQVQIAALRRLLPGRIETSGVAYRLAARPDEIDARRFEAAVGAARASMERRPAAAAAQLADALHAWRGPALDGNATGRMAGAEATRLDALRRAAQIDRADACLNLGENDTVIVELTGLVGADPTDERLAGRLMLAQYRGSGASVALATFERVREALQDELAATPDTDLLELRLAIERRDPTLTGPTAGLPAPVTRFVGRERELQETLDLLGTSRLLTLTGPGGCGKSRLALELARAMAATRLAEVHLVSLATLPPGGSVTRLIADGLDVRERRGESLITGIVSHLRNRRVLLVMDNCEHVLATVAALSADLLAGAPGLRILATSREPLGAPGEVTWALAGLGLPSPAASPAENLAADAMRLLADRAASARPGFDLSGPAMISAVALCRRLDGLPLAIELAAARLRTLSLPDIVERLEGRMDLPASRGEVSAERHRTMRAAIDWSYDLLDEPDRDLFGRLAVFMGGFTLPIAEQVTGAALDGRPELDVMTGVESLLDKSLLRASQADHASEVRLLMLETIREYATERLTASGMTHLLRRRHAESYIALAEAAEPHLLDKEQRAWLERLTSEHDNIRAALAWAIEAEEPVCGLRIGGAVWRFWHQRGHLREGHEWLKRLMAMPGADADARVRVRALIADGGLVYWLRDYDGAFDRYNEALRLATANGDDQGAADATYNLIWIYGIRGDTETGLAMFDDAERRYRALGDELGSTRMRLMAGIQTYLAGDWIRARQDFEQARDRFEALGQRYELGDIEVGIGETYLNTGEPRRALAEYEAGLQVFAEAGNLSGIAMALQSVSVATLEMGEPGTAVRFAGAAHRIEERLGGSAPRELARVFFGPEQRARAIAAIGDDAFERSWEEGRSMDVVDAQALLRDLAMTSD